MGLVRGSWMMYTLKWLKNNWVLALLNVAAKVLWRAKSTPAAFLLVCLAKTPIIFQPEKIAKTRLHTPRMRPCLSNEIFLAKI